MTPSAARKKEAAGRVPGAEERLQERPRLHGALLALALLALTLGFACAPRKTTVPGAEKRPSGRFSFAVVSDTHTGTTAHTGKRVFARLIEQINEKDPDFLVHCGDWIISPTPDKLGEATADTFLHYLSLLDPGIAFYPVLGNHEGDYEDYTYARSFFAVLGESGWYSFDHGSAHFFVVENNSDAPDSGLPGYRFCLPNGGINTPGSPQRNWLASDLANRLPETAWTFGFGHRAYYGAEQYAGRRNIESARRGPGSFCGLVEDAGVDLFFSGDQHCYTRTAPIRGGEACAESESATVYLTVGGGGGRINRGVKVGIDFPALEGLPEGAYAAGTKTRHFFVHCSVEDRLFHADVIDTSGALIDSFSIRK
ncbi:MAG: metallophosphoesterase [Candidatus Eisenbacteria bacterium]